MPPAIPLLKYRLRGAAPAMDLKQIEVFVRVAELGSFTRASIALGVAQPALSRQVRLLEVELRQNLLLRNGRGVSTTDAGRLMLEHGRGILHQVRQAREALATARGAASGQVVLGLPPTVARALAVALTRRFGERFPGSSLSIREGLSVTMHESLVSGRIDLALLYNAPATPDVEIEPLFEEELLLVARRGTGRAQRPASLRELARLPLVIPSRPNAFRMQVESALAAAGLEPNIALEIDGIGAIHDLVAEGAGVAVLTRNAVRTYHRPEVFAVRRIADPGLRCRVSIASSSRRPATPIQRSAAGLLRQTALELLR